MVHSATPPDHRVGHRMGRRLLLSGLIFGGVVVVAASQFRNAPGSILALRQANIGYAGLALLAVAASYIAAALSYQVLAARRVRFGPTLLVQVASGLTNRIIPAGLGSLGLFVAYYRKQGHTTAAASAIAGTNNILGVVGNLLLIVAIVLSRPRYALKFRVPAISLRTSLVAIGVLLIACLAVTLLARSSLGTRMRIFVRQTGHELRRSLRPSPRTFLGLVYNLALTALTALALSLSLLAAHAPLAWSAALLILSLGTVVGAVVPTPGGVGGVEAGLLAGLVAFSVPLPAALAGVLIYRAVTYWLPLLPGLVAFRFIRARYL